MQRFLNLFIFTDAIHVSGGSSAHHQEHITVHTASGIVNQYFCLLLPWRRWNWLKLLPWRRRNWSQFHLLHGSSNTWSCMYSTCAPDDGQRNRL